MPPPDDCPPRRERAWTWTRPCSRPGSWTRQRTRLSQRHQTIRGGIFESRFSGDRTRYKPRANGRNASGAVPPYPGQDTCSCFSRELPDRDWSSLPLPGTGHKLQTASKRPEHARSGPALSGRGHVFLSARERPERERSSAPLPGTGHALQTTRKLPERVRSHPPLPGTGHVF